ncbi:MAG: hypothetical protein LBT59_11915, partial [Clostridiales bacterium]|nr:hypothetical protein [Clostridiales bacterium]
KSNAVNPFIDVPDWAERTAAYAFSIGLTAGVNEERTLFAPSDLVTPHDFTVFLLRVIGYSEDFNDFAYADARRKAVEVGLFKVFESAAINADGVLLRAEAAIAMADALIAIIKNSDSTLVEKLAREGKLSREAVDEFLKAIKVVHKR